jgi:hypothetical protein
MFEETDSVFNINTCNKRPLEKQVPTSPEELPF